MKKLFLPLASILLIGFALVACGKPVGGTTNTPSSGGTACTGGKIEMGSADFVQHTCAIKAGDQITFVDPASTGNYHVLCFGKNEACTADSNGPAELNSSNGVAFNAGDPPKSFTFSTPGTYQVTCTVHTNMDVTITVS